MWQQQLTARALNAHEFKPSSCRNERARPDHSSSRQCFVAVPVEKLGAHLRAAKDHEAPDAAAAIRHKPQTLLTDAAAERDVEVLQRLLASQCESLDQREAKGRGERPLIISLLLSASKKKRRHRDG